MKIKIALFASARELVGSNSVELVLANPATVADLRNALVDSHPGLSNLISSSSFSVDHEYAGDEHVIDDGSEIGMIPPVSGG